MNDATIEVGVRELRDSLSRRLAEVQAGASLVVTEHRRPIARIVPYDAASPLEALLAAGLVERPAQDGPLPAPIRVDVTISDLIDEQRR